MLKVSHYMDLFKKCIHVPINLIILMMKKHTFQTKCNSFVKRAKIKMQKALNNGGKNMKFSKALLIGVAAFSMVACSGHGTAVSKQQYLEEAQRAPEHQYKKATVSFSISLKVSNNITGENENESEKGKAVFVNNDGSFELEAGQTLSELADEVSYYVGGKAAEFAISATIEVKSEDVKYYKAPLGISYSHEEKGSVDGLSGSSKASMYYEFDQYGYLTKVQLKSSSKYSGKILGKTYTTSHSENVELNISYQ